MIIKIIVTYDHSRNRTEISPNTAKEIHKSESGLCDSFSTGVQATTVTDTELTTKSKSIIICYSLDNNSISYYKYLEI